MASSFVHIHGAGEMGDTSLALMVVDKHGPLESKGSHGGLDFSEWTTLKSRRASQIKHVCSSVSV